MRSFIRLYGPPIIGGIKALEKIAIDAPEVCIMDTIIAQHVPSLDQEGAHSYFSMIGDITRERCGKIISKSDEMLGEYDFFFEWFKEPDVSELHDLIDKIDAALAEVGCIYTITTKKN
jgi:hypothetical protein